MKLKLGDKVEILLNNNCGKEEIIGAIEITDEHLRYFDEYTEEIEIGDTDIVEINSADDTISKKYIVYETLKAEEVENELPIICIQKLTPILSFSINEMNNNLKKIDNLNYKMLIKTS